MQVTKDVYKFEFPPSFATYNMGNEFSIQPLHGNETLGFIINMTGGVCINEFNEIIPGKQQSTTIIMECDDDFENGLPIASDSHGT